MKRIYPVVGVYYVAATLIFAIAPQSLGQVASAPQSATADAAQPKDEEVLQLSPFVVEETAGQNTYRVNSTLAGTRVRTELKDVASALSVVTSQFMQDIGATNNQTLLQYTPNTEVGGVYGNFGGVGSTFINGASESANFLNPNQNTRVRGLDSADNTRDYFLTSIPWDSYIVDRVDLQRGPNSILFGIGSPAGIINTSINTAAFKDSYKIENRFGSFDSVRNSLDFNHVLIDNELSIRIAALDNDSHYRQNPTFNRDRRVFGAVRWEPKFFDRTSAHTTIRANFESGDVKANRPRILPPIDQITPWFTSAFNKMTYDPIYTQAAAIQASASGGGTDAGAHFGEARNPWVTQGMGPGLLNNYNPLFFYNNLTSPSTPIAAMQAKTYAWGGINSSGNQIGAIAGFPYGALAGIGGYNYYSYYNNKYHPTDPTTLGAASNLYKDKSITDPTIFDFYNNLIDGPNKKEWQGWQAFNLALDQTLFHDRLGIQMVYDYQRYHEGSERNLSTPFISIDINANTINTSPWAYYAPYVAKYDGTGTPGTNPYAGAAFVGSSAKNGGNTSNSSTRENFRATATYELRATDFLSKSSWLSDLLGRHVFTGLYSKETYNAETRNWVRYAVDRMYDQTIGPGSLNANGLTSGNTVLEWVSYLSAPLFSASSASGLNLKPITTVQAPSGTANIQWFNTRWKPSTNPTDPTYVDPAAPWTNPTVTAADNAASPFTQSGNPANYIGWTNGDFRILNADQGDINSLYTDANKIQTITDSKALTWQAFLWEDTIAATAGWRRDTQKQRAGSATVSPVLGAASMDYDLAPLDPVLGVVSGNSTSWGIVLHEPKFLRNKLPWGTNVSLFYNNSENSRVQTRYGFSGNLLPNAKGKTKDYGFVVNTLNDQLQFKVTWYKTNVTDANIASVTTGTSTLGSQTYNLYQLEGTGTVSAMLDKRGFAGQGAGNFWYWSWAWVDRGFDLAYADPNSAAFLNDPITIKEKQAVDSWLAQMQPQSWFDAYNFNVNVAAAKAGDWINAIPGYDYEGAGSGGLNAGGAGRVNGLYPTGTVDNESKGIEFEIVGQPAKNWNVAFNASKQNASQTALGTDITTFIEAQHAKFQTDAGLLRLYWAGDQDIRTYYNTTIWAAYQFQKGTNGKMVSEMSPWRYNFVTSYAFDRGPLKGVNVGGAYRWQQGAILGYALNAAGDNLDVTKPYWGKAQDATDLWIGYGRKLTDKISWHIQLNIRNAGDKVHLQPISIQPDGSPAGYRIVEGQTWEITNTLKF